MSDSRDDLRAPPDRRASSACARPLACSKRMCGGSGGTSGSVITSSSGGPAGRQRLVPGRPDVLGPVDPDAVQAEQPRVVGVGEVGQHLRGVELGVAGHHALLPGDLVEVVVVQHADDELLVAPAVAVAGDVDQRVDAEHLHRAVADRGDHRPVGVARTSPPARTGTAGHIVASVPDSAAFMPSRIRRWRAHQFVADPESAVRMQPSGSRSRELVEDQLRVDAGRRTGGRARRGSRHQRSTLASISSRHARSSLRLQQREQRAQRLRRVADEVDLHRVAHADQPAVDVDLHAARLARLGQPLRVREARADHQQRVAALHHVVGRLGAEQADRAGHVRQRRRGARRGR